MASLLRNRTKKLDQLSFTTFQAEFGINIFSVGFSFPQSFRFSRDSEGTEGQDIILRRNRLRKAVNE